MSNLGPREKYLVILFGIVLIIMVVYFFGIKPLSEKNDALTTEKTTLQANLDYYKALQAQNEVVTNEIAELKADISEIEDTFIPEINTEVLEQYVLSVFEKNECPYLVNVTSESLASPTFNLPDGSVAEETLNIKRINVSYASTDGINFPQYNRSDSLIDPSTGRITEDQAQIDAILDGIYWKGEEGCEGYEEFIASLKEIRDANPNCIKVSSIAVETTAGYKVLTASIDFYAANLIDRVSTAINNNGYATWAGVSSYDTGVAMIGLPYFVSNPDSAWFGFYTSAAGTSPVPFAMPFSSSYYANNLANDTLTDLIGGEVPEGADADADAGNDGEEA